MSTHDDLQHARDEFEQAWENAAHTRTEPEAVDVNALLRESFSVDDGVQLTRQMLWEAEVEKAWDPGAYIPGVVLEGESWGRKELADGGPWFVRASRQVAWKRETEPGVVLEEVYLDPARQSVLFFGRSELVKPDGSRLEAGKHQPLFHVEHAVTGTDERPLNRWRIVHLTEAEDPGLVARQSEEGTEDWLVGFLARFVEVGLGRQLEPR